MEGSRTVKPSTLIGRDEMIAQDGVPRTKFSDVSDTSTGIGNVRRSRDLDEVTR